MLCSAIDSVPELRKTASLDGNRKGIQFPPRHRGTVGAREQMAVSAHLPLPGGRWRRLPQGGDI